MPIVKKSAHAGGGEAPREDGPQRSPSNAASWRCACVSTSTPRRPPGSAGGRSADRRRSRRPRSSALARRAREIRLPGNTSGTPPGRPPRTGVARCTVETTRPSCRQRCSMGCWSAAGTATGVKGPSARPTGPELVQGDAHHGLDRHEIHHGPGQRGPHQASPGAGGTAGRASFPPRRRRARQRRRRGRGRRASAPRARRRTG